ncbi:copper homeostasis protein CutC [Ferdinandcohnia quinoae]|uniref:PF03932 family protein CutC n=1 Tax=Fredinandcohnia quinoae TaxID=2918902 RepID=A0AAW5E254_9BACI|nr:copper homeostasis protein CutC [Fredinandcohnia sp. SECRCQ15]MCH1626985.1 copper homeostasis protein CutC [Fredinandcohnia sp. SECRCQ15]
MIIEIIAQNVEDAVSAEKNGADRLELVTAMTEGGLTPSFGTVKQVVNSVKIPVRVMVRPHGYSFVYSDEDKQVIIEDIREIKEIGAAGIVFGSLTEDGNIDEEFLQKVIDAADGMEIAFHRAIDDTKDQLAAFELLQKYSDSIHSILTSGGKPTALAGMENLEEMITRSNEKPSPTILPGSGLSLQNIAEIHSKLHAKEYHFGSAVRVNGKFSEPIDGIIIKQIREIVG